jgi:transposase InsO family protein
MQEEQQRFPVGKMAKVLKASVSGYYAYLRRKPSLREEKNKRLIDLIRRIYREGRSMYGSPRIHNKLKNQKDTCSRKTVARLMKRYGIAAKREIHRDKILDFLKRKLLQYEKLLEKLVHSTDHPDITEKTLFEYRSKASKLVNTFNTCCEIK